MARKMKDSGVEWIGMIPNGWQVCPIKYVATLYTGNSIKDEDKDFYMDSDDARPYVATKDVDALLGTVNYDNGQYIKRADTSFKVAPANSILMCIEGGSAGRKKALLNQEVSFVNKLCCFNGSSKIDGSYLYRFLSSPNYEEEFACHVSGMIGGVSVSELKSIPVIVPPLSEQQRIANFLDAKCASIDNVIAKTTESIEEYKKLKQAVITEAVTKGVRGKRPMKDSGIDWIGQIPEGWCVLKSRYVIDNLGDVDHYMPQSVDVGVPYVMTGDLKDYVSQIEFDACKQISQDDYIELSKKTKAVQGDVIFARYATIGTVSYVDVERDFIISYSCLTVHPNVQKIDGKYLFYYFKSMAFLEDVKQYVNTNIQGNVGIESLYKAKCIVPNTLDEQREIADYLDSKCAAIDTLISKKQQFIDELTAYKKSLIYEYVTGKKEVPA